MVLGDSITHGFWSSQVARTWPVSLAKKTGREIVNLGYGARMCVPSDGTAAAALEPDTLVYFIGFNEFWQQKTDFGDRYRKTLDNIRARPPGVKIVAVTPTCSSVEKSIPLEAYRQEIRDAVLADVTLVEGMSLTSSDLVAFPDTVHPGDAGAAGIAAGLAGVV